jgi:ubiquitin-protein ligase
MLGRERWHTECVIMARTFPQFKPFATSGIAGFKGYLRGPRTGTYYHVTVQAPVAQYPATAPAIYITPKPETHHYYTNGQLCVITAWIPSRSTLAHMILLVIAYVDEFDGRGGHHV